MQQPFRDELLLAARAKISAYDKYLRAVQDENRRRERRSAGKPTLMIAHRPQLWDAAPGYDPHHVRRRADAIAHAVVASIRRAEYLPVAPLGFMIPKPGGGERMVSAFQLADEVVSRRLLKALSRKNEARLSSRAYGYRPRLSVHDAIAYVSSEFGRAHRLFVAEFDFSKFFDHVSHSYVHESMERLGIIQSQSEKNLIQAFLGAPNPRLLSSIEPPSQREVGLPQGTSISLFLANVVASELDRSLERVGVGFARYADDTLIWSDDYGRVTDAVSALYESAEQIGASINTAKSPGVRLLVPPGTEKAEMRKVYSVNFLGHNVSLRKVKMRDSAIDRIKSRITALLFDNLLREPLAGTQSVSRLTHNDRDYATFVWQLRRYMYGPLSEADVRRFREGRIPAMSFEGVMSFFPLVNDLDSLEELDRWLVSQVWLCMRKRARLLKRASLPVPAPHGLEKAELLGWRTFSGTSGDAVDLRLPSFSRMAGLIRAAVTLHGLHAISRRSVSDYHYGEPAEL